MPSRKIRKRKKRRSLKRRLAAKLSVTKTGSTSSGDTGETDTSDDDHVVISKIGHQKGSDEAKAGKMARVEPAEKTQHRQQQQQRRKDAGFRQHQMDADPWLDMQSFRERSQNAHHGHKDHLAAGQVHRGSGLRRSGSAREHTNTSDSLASSHGSPRLQRGGSTKEPARNNQRLHRSESAREHKSEHFSSWSEISKSTGKTDSRNAGKASFSPPANWNMPQGVRSAKGPPTAGAVKTPLRCTSSEENIRLQEGTKNPPSNKSADSAKNIPRDKQQTTSKDNEDKSPVPTRKRSGKRRKRRKSSLTEEGDKIKVPDTDNNNAFAENESQKNTSAAPTSKILSTAEEATIPERQSPERALGLLEEEETSPAYLGEVTTEQRPVNRENHTQHVLLPSLSTDRSTSDDLTDATLQDYNIATTRTSDWVSQTWDGGTVQAPWADQPTHYQNTWNDEFALYPNKPPQYTSKKPIEKLILAHRGESMESSEYAADDESTPKDDMSFDQFDQTGNPAAGSLLFGGLGALERATSLITKLAKEMSPEPKSDGTASQPRDNKTTLGSITCQNENQTSSDTIEKDAVIAAIATTEPIAENEMRLREKEVFSEAREAGYEVVGSGQDTIMQSMVSTETALPIGVNDSQLDEILEQSKEEKHNLPIYGHDTRGAYSFQPNPQMPVSLAVIGSLDNSIEENLEFTNRDSSATPFFFRLPSVEHMEFTCVECRKQCDAADFVGHSMDQTATLSSELVDELNKTAAGEETIPYTDKKKPDLMSADVHSEENLECDSLEEEPNQYEGKSSGIKDNNSALQLEDDSLEEDNVSPQSQDSQGRATAPARSEFSESQATSKKPSSIGPPDNVIGSVQDEQWLLSQGQQDSEASVKYQTKHAVEEANTRKEPFSDDSIENEQADLQERIPRSEPEISSDKRPELQDDAATRDVITTNLPFTVGVEEQVGGRDRTPLETTRPTEEVAVNAREAVENSINQAKDTCLEPNVHDAGDTVPEPCEQMPPEIYSLLQRDQQVMGMMSLARMAEVRYQEYQAQQGVESNSENRVRSTDEAFVKETSSLQSQDVEEIAGTEPPTANERPRQTEEDMPSRNDQNLENDSEVAGQAMSRIVAEDIPNDQMDLQEDRHAETTGPANRVDSVTTDNLDEDKLTTSDQLTEVYQTKGAINEALESEQKRLHQLALAQVAEVAFEESRARDSPPVEDTPDLRYLIPELTIATKREAAVGGKPSSADVDIPKDSQQEKTLEDNQSLMHTADENEIVAEEQVCSGPTDLAVCLSMRSDESLLQQAVQARQVESLYRETIASHQEVEQVETSESQENTTTKEIEHHGPPADEITRRPSRSKRVADETSIVQEIANVKLREVDRRDINDKAIRQSLEKDCQLLQWSKSAEFAETMYHETLVRFVEVVFFEPRASEQEDVSKPSSAEDTGPSTPASPETRESPTDDMEGAVGSVSAEVTGDVASEPLEATTEVATESSETFEEVLDGFTLQKISGSKVEFEQDVCLVQAVTSSVRMAAPDPQRNELQTPSVSLETAAVVKEPMKPCSSEENTTQEVIGTRETLVVDTCKRADPDVASSVSASMREDCEQLLSERLANIAETKHQCALAEVQDATKRKKSETAAAKQSSDRTTEESTVGLQTTEIGEEQTELKENVKDDTNTLSCLQDVAKFLQEDSKRLQQLRYAEDAEAVAMSLAQEERNGQNVDPGICKTMESPVLEAVSSSKEVWTEEQTSIQEESVSSASLQSETCEHEDMAREEVDLAIDEALSMLSEDDTDDVAHTEEGDTVPEDVHGLVSSLVVEALDDALSVFHPDSSQLAVEERSVEKPQLREDTDSDSFEAPPNLFSDAEDELETESAPCVGLSAVQIETTVEICGEADSHMVTQQDVDSSSDSSEMILGDLISDSEEEPKTEIDIVLSNNTTSAGEKQDVMDRTQTDEVVQTEISKELTNKDIDSSSEASEVVLGDLISDSEEEHKTEIAIVLSNNTTLVGEKQDVMDRTQTNEVVQTEITKELTSKDIDSSSDSSEMVLGDLISDSEPEEDQQTEVAIVLSNDTALVGEKQDVIESAQADDVVRIEITEELTSSGKSHPVIQQDVDSSSDSSEVVLGDLIGDSEPEDDHKKGIAGVGVEENRHMMGRTQSDEVVQTGITEVLTSSGKAEPRPVIQQHVDSSSDSSEIVLGDLISDSEPEDDHKTVSSNSALVEDKSDVIDSAKTDEVVQDEITEEPTGRLEKETIELPEANKQTPTDTAAQDVYLAKESTKLVEMQVCTASETAYQEHVARSIEDMNNNNMTGPPTPRTEKVSDVRESVVEVIPEINTSTDIARDAFSPPVGGAVLQEAGPEDHALASEILADSSFWEEVWHTYRDDCGSLWQMAACEEAESKYMEQQSAKVEETPVATAQMAEPCEQLVVEERAASMEEANPAQAIEEVHLETETMASCTVEIVMPDVFGVAFVEASCQDYEQMRQVKEAEHAEELYMSQYVIETEDCQELIEIFGDQIEMIGDKETQEPAQIEMGATLIVPEIGLYTSLCSHLDPYADSDSEEECDCEIHGRVQRWKHNDNQGSGDTKLADTGDPQIVDLTEFETDRLHKRVPIQKTISETSDTSSQTEIEYHACCKCNVLTLPLEETFKQKLREEIGQTAALEQLVNILEEEGKQLRQAFTEERTNTADLKATVAQLQKQLTEQQKIAESQRTEKENREKELETHANKISDLEKELEEKNKAYQSVSDSLMDARLAENRATSVQARVRMLETQLDLARNQSRQLFAKLASVDRDRSEMMSETVHHELLSIADDRANLADSKVQQLEHKLIEAKNHLEEARSRKWNFPTTCHSVKDYPSLISTTLASPSGALFNPPGTSACSNPITSSTISSTKTVSTTKKVPRQHSPGTPIPGSILDNEDSDIEESKDPTSSAFNFQMFSMFGDQEEPEHQPMCTTSDSIYSSTSPSGSGSTTEDSPDRQTPGNNHFFGPQSPSEDQNPTAHGNKQTSSGSNSQTTSQKTTSTLFKPITLSEKKEGSLDEVDLPDFREMQRSTDMELRISESPSDEPSELSDWSSSDSEETTQQCELQIVEDETSRTTSQPAAAAAPSVGTPLQTPSTSSVWVSPRLQRANVSRPIIPQDLKASGCKPKSPKTSPQSGIESAQNLKPTPKQNTKLGETRYVKDPNGNQELPTTTL